VTNFTDAKEGEDYWRGYKAGLADQSGSDVLQAVLDAIDGTLDPHTQIADHPNVKFAQRKRIELLRTPCGSAPKARPQEDPS
jgi:hypothetical protein